MFLYVEVAGCPTVTTTVWFGAELSPALDVDRFADASGDRVHLRAASVRRLCLDRAYAGGSKGDASSAAIPRRLASA